MKGKGALVLMLLTAGSLIFAASRQPHDGARAGRGAATTTSTTSATSAMGGQLRLAKTARTGDGLAWLGAPPAGFTEAVLTERLEGLLARMRHDVPTGQDTSRFVCKLPAEVGPVPMLEAVDAYLRGLPASRNDPALLRGLHRAAARGNWLAKVQVYLALSEHPAPDRATAWRTLQLMEWMQERRIGALYGAVSDTLAASQYRGDMPGTPLTGLDIYAAMHHSYPAQYKVGRELVRSGDATQAAIGRRMLDCAARALPAYGHWYGEEAVARR